MSAGQRRLLHFEEELLTMVLDAAKTREVSVPESPPTEGKRSWLRRRWIAVAAATFLATAAIVLVPALSDDLLGGALAIERHGDVLRVWVKDAAADPQAMTNDLRASGIDAEVVSVPAVPNDVGRWIEAEYDVREATGLFSHSKGGIEPISIQVARNVKVLRIPAEFSTWIRLAVGRPAEPGEDYVEGGGQNELMENGALECLGLDEMSPSRAEKVLARFDYELIWAYDEVSHSEPPATGRIYWAWFQSPDVLHLVVDLSGDSRLQEDHERPTGIDGPCD
jgi:hypothetical protein